MILSKDEKAKRSEERRLIKYNKTHKEMDGIIYKQCSLHKKYFPDEDEWIQMAEEYFYLNKMNGMDGFNTYCKKCTLKKRKQYQLENYVDGGKLKKYCRRVYIDQKDVMKKRDQERNKSEKRKEQNRTNLKKWQENNKDKLKEYNRKYSNKKHKISKTEWIACKNYFKNKNGEWACAYCGKTYTQNYEETRKDLHKEHIIDCGRIDLKNCVPACRNCNLSKHQDSFNDWYNEDNPVYDRERYYKIYKWIRYDCKKYIEKKKQKKK